MMRRQSAWIIIGVLSIVLVLLMAVVGVGGWYVWGVARQQQQQIASLNATLVAGENNSPAATREQARPTIRPTQPAVNPPEPTLVPVPSPATPRATPSAVVATATSQVAAEPTRRPSPSTTDGTAVVANTAASGAVLVPAYQDALAQHPNIPRYTIDAQLDPATHTIVGTQSVELHNTEAVALDAIYLRLYVNAPHYDEGGIEVKDVRVAGQVVQTSLEVDDTALKIELPQPLAPNQAVTLEMRFTTTVPQGGGGYGIFNEADGVWALYNWHPELAVYENDGWLLNPIGDQGDPTNTDVANYAVSFAAPEDYTVVSSGVEVATRQDAAAVVHQIEGALGRNMVLVVSDQFQRASQQVGGTTVNSYFRAADAAGGRAALGSAARALELFNQRFGAYAYPELDVTEVELGGGAAGMEATGLIMIGSDYYDPSQDVLAGLGDLVPGAEDVNALDFTVAHEVGHQWWYGMVGSDAYRQPWLDESLTNWSSAFYVDETAGETAGRAARDIFIDLPYRLTLSKGDQRLDQPVDQFDQEGYGAVVYGKGALMYDVLRAQIGDEKFFAFLRRYFQAQQWGRADGTVWQATLAAVTDPQTAADFYRKWVEGSAIQSADLPPGGPFIELLDGFGGLGGGDALDELFATPTPR